MIDLTRQVLNPNDDTYINTGILPGTYEVTGMSGDTSPAFREKLDREREEKWLQDFCEEYDR